MLRQQTATDIEQSRRVLACGIDRSTADMYFGKATVPPAEYYLYPIHDGINAKKWFSVRSNKDIIPSWSLAALVTLLPPKITTSKEGYLRKRDYRFRLFPVITGKWWYAAYVYELAYDYKHLIKNESIIEAVVQIIETLYKDGEYRRTAEEAR